MTHKFGIDILHAFDSETPLVEIYTEELITHLTTKMLFAKLS